ncbi:MAG: hypothetical protein WB817_09990 [Terriglobales bacterium]
MDLPVLKRLPCSVCGLVTLGHEGWFLVMENRWLDRLKILTWHATLARQGNVRSACCREHLKLLVAYWLEESSLRLASPACRVPTPLAGIPEGSDAELGRNAMGCFIAELSVSREPFSRAWKGSAESLESILEALTVTRSEKKPPVRASRFYNPQPWSLRRLVLH